MCAEVSCTHVFNKLSGCPAGLPIDLDERCAWVDAQLFAFERTRVDSSQCFFADREPEARFTEGRVEREAGICRNRFGNACLVRNVRWNHESLQAHLVSPDAANAFDHDDVDVVRKRGYRALRSMRGIFCVVEQRAPRAQPQAVNVLAEARELRQAALHGPSPNERALPLPAGDESSVDERLEGLENGGPGELIVGCKRGLAGKLRSRLERLVEDVRLELGSHLHVQRGRTTRTIQFKQHRCSLVFLVKNRLNRLSGQVYSFCFRTQLQPLTSDLDRREICPLCDYPTGIGHGVG